MGERQVQVRVQPEQRHLPEVSRIQMRHHMEQLPQYFARNMLKGGGKLIGVLGGEHQLVAHRALRERHHIVHVLGRRHARLFTFLVVPQIRSKEERNR